MHRAPVAQAAPFQTISDWQIMDKLFAQRRPDDDRDRPGRKDLDDRPFTPPGRHDQQGPDRRRSEDDTRPPWRPDDIDKTKRKD